MENKLTIEITNKSVKRTFEYEGEVFVEEMAKLNPGIWGSTGAGLWAQVEESENIVEDEIIDLIDGNDFYELMECL